MRAEEATARGRRRAILFPSPKHRMHQLRNEKITAPVPTRAQVRAARALLDCKQERLAHMAGIGLATLRRYEGGQTVGRAQLEAVGRALRNAGVILMSAGMTGGGAALGEGVMLRGGRAVPAANDDGRAAAAAASPALAGSRRAV